MLSLISGTICGVDDDPYVYEARYGLGGRTGVMIVISLVFAALGLLPGLSAGVRITCVALFGGGGLLMLGVAATRQVAFRVDASGVTLGGMPPRYRSGTRFCPWADIERVVLWRQRLPHGASMRYVGLVRRADAPPLAGRRAALAGRVAARALTPGISGDTLMASRAINGWRLDEARLASAVGHFAPGAVIDR